MNRARVVAISRISLSKPSGTVTRRLELAACANWLMFTPIRPSSNRSAANSLRNGSRRPGEAPAAQRSDAHSAALTVTPRLSASSLASAASSLVARRRMTSERGRFAGCGRAAESGWRRLLGMRHRASTDGAQCTTFRPILPTLSILPLLLSVLNRQPLQIISLGLQYRHITGILQSVASRTCKSLIGRCVASAAFVLLVF